MIKQFKLTLKPYPRGFHLVTQEIMSQIPELPESGLLNLFIQHSSAGLTINENADPSVRVDFESIFNKLVPENEAYYTHVMEGPDDMPAHVKASLVGSSVNIPVQNGRTALGTWQGIYLCEFRNHASSRRILATLFF